MLKISINCFNQRIVLKKTKSSLKITEPCLKVLENDRKTLDRSYVPVKEIPIQINPDVLLFVVFIIDRSDYRRCCSK